MNKIITYLSFNGNCREAMLFYKETLGGELVFQTLEDTPEASNLPALIKKHILQATLINGQLIIMGSDLLDEKGLKKGNAVSLMITCDSESHALQLFEKLSSGGEATNPPTKNYWGSLFGNLTDKYGNNWMLHFQQTL
jgi:PhnB protein